MSEFYLARVEKEGGGDLLFGPGRSTIIGGGGGKGMNREILQENPPAGEGCLKEGRRKEGFVSRSVEPPGKKSISLTCYGGERALREKKGGGLRQGRGGKSLLAWGGGRKEGEIASHSGGQKGFNTMGKKDLRPRPKVWGKWEKGEARAKDGREFAAKKGALDKARKRAESPKERSSYTS